MRLFVLPVSTRQALLYCQRRVPRPDASVKPSLSDRVTQRASQTWLNWEKKDSGWQKRVTDYGNKLFQRLPYQEYGLKSLPPLTATESEHWRQLESKHKGSGDTAGHELKERGAKQTDKETTVSVEFPAGLIDESRVLDELNHLGSNDTQAFHRKWFVGSLLGMPLSAPFALIPM